MFISTKGLRVCACFALIAGCSMPVDSSQSSEHQTIDHSESELLAAAPPMPAAATAAISGGGQVSQALLDRIFTLDHFVPVGQGRKIHLTETFSVRSLLRWPHRAMVMIPSSGSNNEFFNPPFEGYNGREIMARRGFFSFSADTEGMGESTFPADGFAVTYDRETEVFRTVLNYVRLVRLVPRVDVLGESLGGGIALQLCASATLTRSCTASSMIYRTGTDFFNAVFGSPEFRAFLLSSPNGYLTTNADTYFNIVAGATPEIADWVRTTQPGPYAVGQFIEDFNLPSYDPTHAAVPGLIIRGEFDQNVPLSDSIELANAYGSATGTPPAQVAISPAELVPIPNGTHIVRLDSPPRGTAYWNIVSNFVDP